MSRYTPMTQAERYAFIKNNILRRYFRRYPAYGECLRRAKSDQFVENVRGQLTIRRVFYKCADCQHYYPRKDVCVDHIVPVVGVDGWDGDWNKIVDGMFCELDNLQVMCNYSGIRVEDGIEYRSCHYWKTQAERSARAAHRKGKK